MLINFSEITLPLYHMITTCQILFGWTFDTIEPKTGVKANNIVKLIKQANEWVGFNGFHKVLV